MSGTSHKGYLLQSPALSFLFRARLRKTLPARMLYRRKRNRGGDVYLISFPKAGRTWLRIMLGKVLALHYGLEDSGLLELHRLAETRPGIPRIRLKHDDNPQKKTPKELVTLKYEYRDRKVILLIRDIRDLAVSNYFEVTRRRHFFNGDLSSYLRCKRGSVDSMIGFYNIWADNRDAAADFLLVRYEDIHADTDRELRRILDFIGIKDVSPSTIREAIDFSSFENMRKMELGDDLDSGRLRAADSKDPESFKTRKGKVGGYTEYLSEEEIEELTRRIREELSPFYGYP